jgi:PAP2 superfamily protein
MCSMCSPRVFRWRMRQRLARVVTAAGTSDNLSSGTSTAEHGSGLASSGGTRSQRSWFPHCNVPPRSDQAATPWRRSGGRQILCASGVSQRGAHAEDAHRPGGREDRGRRRSALLVGEQAWQQWLEDGGQPNVVFRRHWLRVAPCFEAPVLSERPDRTVARNHHRRGIPRSGDAWESFPSGHAINLGAVAAPLARSLPSTFRPTVWPALSLLAASRVLLLAHYPSDVAAGLGIGVLVERVTSTFLDRRSHRATRRSGRSARNKPLG